MTSGILHKAVRTGRDVAQHFSYLAEGRHEAVTLLERIGDLVQKVTHTPNSLNVHFRDKKSLLVASHPATPDQVASAPALLQPLFQPHRTLTLRQTTDTVTLQLVSVSLDDIAKGNEFTALFPPDGNATSPVNCPPDFWVWHPQSTAACPKMILWDHAENQGTVFAAGAGMVFLHRVAQLLNLPVPPLTLETVPARTSLSIPRYTTNLEPTDTRHTMAYGAPAFVPTPENPDGPRQIIKGVTVADDLSRVGFIHESAADSRRHVFETWDYTTGASLGVIDGVPEERRLFVSRSFDRALFFNEVGTLTSPPKLLYRLPHSGIERAMFADDGGLLFTHGRGTEIGIWDATTGQLKGASVSEEPSGAKIAAVDFKTGLLALALNGARVPTLYQYEPLNAKRVRQIDEAPPHEAEILSMSLAHGRPLLACGDESGLVRVYDAQHKRPIGEYFCGKRLRQVELSPDGRWLLTMAGVSTEMGTRFSLWNVRSGVVHICGDCYMTAARWASNSRAFFVANYWATVLRYDVPEGQQ